jgi:hypothetical protein
MCSQGHVVDLYCELINTIHFFISTALRFLLILSLYLYFLNHGNDHFSSGFHLPEAYYMLIPFHSLIDNSNNVL